MKAQTLKISYSVWKTIAQANPTLTPYFHEDDGVTEQGSAYIGTDEYVYITRIVDDTWLDFDANFPVGTRVAVARRDDAFANIVGLGNVPKSRKTSDGKTIVSTWPTEGSRKTVITANWADKSTWYYDSAYVEADLTTPTVSGTAYQLSNTTVVDTVHGKITGEGSLTRADGKPFLVSVSGTVSGTTNVFTEVDPHTGVGDFTLDYTTGTLTFNPTIDIDTEVRATYCTPTSSTFIFGPTPGKTLMVKDVEVQFSMNLEITDTVTFEAYGFVDVFAPHLLQSNGGPLPSGYKIPLSKTTYKTMMDYVNEASGSLPVITKLGGTSWRGMPDDVVVFPWNYQAMTALSSAAGMEVRIKLEHDIPFEGDVATVTFYCLSEDA